MQPLVRIIQAQEPLLDERQQRSVIPHGMGHIVRLREWRNGHQRNTESQLVKTSALLGIWPRRVRCKSRAQRLGILYARVYDAEWILSALRPPPGCRLKGRLDRSAHCPGEIPFGVLAPPWRAFGGATWS